MNKCICDLKDGEEKLINRGSWNDLYIEMENGEYRIAAIADGRASIKINFCPICGRKLEEEKEEKDIWQEV